MITTVSNPCADRNEKISDAASVLGRSSHRRKVFEAIYTGKKKTKSVSEIIRLSGISNKILVLQEAAKLVHHGIVKQLPKRVNNETVYEKDGFYQHTKKQILSACGNKEKIAKIATRFNPKLNIVNKVSHIPPKSSFSVAKITIDDIDNLAKVKNVKNKLAPRQLMKVNLKK